MNYLHGISAYQDEVSNIVNTVVEIPKGSFVKNEITECGTALRAVRMIHPKYKYIFNYGYIPRTFAGDSDPLDVVIICEESLAPLTIVACKIVGVVKTIDMGEQDDKIICVPAYTANKKRAKIHMGKYMRFFKKYKYPYQYNTIIQGICGPKEATQIVDDAIKSYEAKENEIC